MGKHINLTGKKFARLYVTGNFFLTKQGRRKKENRMAEYIERGFALDVVKRTSGDYAAAFAEIAQADRKGRCVVLEKRCNDG